MGLAAMPRSQNDNPVLWPDLPPADLHPYLDPFSNECRAYARLKETGKEHMAIECQGYVCFSESYLEEKGVTLGTWPRLPLVWKSKRRKSSKLARLGCHDGRNGGDDKSDTSIEEGEKSDDEDHATKTNRLIYALLKDLPPENESRAGGHGRPTRAQLSQMARDLVALHKVGIFLDGALTPSAYVAGKLVDFGVAQTVPHPLLDGAGRYGLFGTVCHQPEESRSPMRIWRCAWMQWEAGRAPCLRTSLRLTSRL
jgi:hypothetical protein